MSHQSSIPVKPRTRRSHTKSRSGCTNCKRRKVKCDNVRPVCSSCTRFHLQCYRNPPSASSTPPPPATDAALPSRQSKRGRPRNDWSESSSQETSVSASASATVPLDPCSTSSCGLNHLDIQLLLYFFSRTAQSFSGTPQADGETSKFWTHDVLQLGISAHYILHLCFALAGYHLAQSEDQSSSKQREITLHAHNHYQKGVAEFSLALSGLDSTNAGTLYVGAMLVCFGRFAAGPEGPGDLAVCDTDGDNSGWLPLIRGVRLIRETTDADSVVKDRSPPEGEDISPEHPYIPWEKPLQELRDSILSCDLESKSTYLHSLGELVQIYEATYGREDGSCSVLPHNRFTFGWLYRMEDAFVVCLQRKEPIALLLLAYYSLLLRTMKESWVVNGWCEHLLRGISAILDSDLHCWLQWPKDQAGVGK